MSADTVPTDNSILHVPARDIPIPQGLSPEAARMLSTPSISNPPWPPVGDTQAWRGLVTAMDARGLAGLTMMSEHIPARVEETEVDGVRVYVVTPDGLDPDDQAVYLDIHGGALLWGGGPSCAALAKITAGMMRSRVWAVDYRLPPDHPYPAGLDDCLAVYRALLRERMPENIAIGGASAGGNLAPATVLRARDEGLPLPAAVVLMTPEADLTEAGDSFNTLIGIDTGLTSRLMPANLVYAGGADLTDPYVSPIFGDFSKGFAPSFLSSGTRDLFLSNTVRFHRALRRAGVEAALHVWDAAGHIGFGSGPEAEDRNREIREFLAAHWVR